MAKITLREYVKEIEGLIDRRQIEEAIAHSRHILEAFPKHIDSYRLLGKAFLEIQRYSDASDIFQRVLSAVPDDFVSNVGMSIIREDENNIEAAIWHMERAFERQPYNAAIQSELKRLYGIRDGMEPPKVRLTRGALARMYAKGNLYQQAIAELRTALSEDPDRPDLSVVLADMYAKNGQNIEAIETCGSILNKLPYCLQANQILAKILEETGRHQEADRYRKRLRSLDPYEAHLTPQIREAQEVPNEAVTVHRLEWTGSLISSGEGQPDWAKSLGVDLTGAVSGEEELPDWLKSSSETAEREGVAQADPDKDEISFRWEDDSSQDVYAAAAQEEDDDTIPPWMKEAGWETAGEGPSDSETGERVITPEPEGGEIEPGDMPDWLKDLEPEQDAEPSMEGDSGELHLDEKGTDWFTEITESVKSTESADFVEETEVDWEEVDTPDWLIDLSDEDQETQFVPETEEDYGQPDWSDEDDQFDSEEMPAQPSDWLSELDSEEVSDEVEAHEEALDFDTSEMSMPGWLEQLGADEESSVDVHHPEEEVEPEDLLPDQEIPEWLTQIGKSEAEESDAEEEEIEITEDESIWEEEEEKEEVSLDFSTSGELSKEDFEPLVESLQSKEEVSEIQLESQEEEEDLPEWLQEVVEQTSEEPEAVETSPKEYPDWISEIEEESSETEEELPAETEEMVEAVAQEGVLEEVEFEEKIEPEKTDEVIAEDVPAEDEGAVQAAESIETDEAEEELPEWLAEEAEVETPEAEIPEAEEDELPEWMKQELAEMDEDERFELEPESVSSEPDDALAWLEGLAAKQGVSEEELISSPEDRSKDLPEFAPEEQEEEEVEQELETLSEDLRSGEFLAEEIEEAEAEIEPDLPEWMQDTSPSSDFEEVDEEIESPEWMQEESPEVEDEIPDWVEAIPTEEEEQEEVEEVGELPEWLETLGEEKGMVEVEHEPEEEEVEDLPSWAMEVDEEIEEVAELEETIESSKPEDWIPEVPPEELEEVFETDEPVADLEPTMEVEEEADEEAVLESIFDPPTWVKRGEEPEDEEQEWMPPAVMEEMQKAAERKEEVDLNSISLVDLERLPGVGYRAAQAIINYRDEHGRFSSIEDLQQIPDLDETSIEIISSMVSISAPQTIKDIPLDEETEEKEIFKVPQTGKLVDEEYANIVRARELIDDNDYASAVDNYNQVLKKGYYLEKIITDLEKISETTDDNFDIWQTLGDAYVRTDKLDEALNAYNEAERLLRLSNW